MAITIPLLFALVGLLMYAFASGKVERIGEWMFVCGLLAFLLHGPENLLKLL